MVVDSTTSIGKAFERKVANLFVMLGYSVECDVSVADRQIDLILRDRSGPLSRVYVVECKNQATPVNSTQYDAFYSKLSSAKTALGPKVRGIIVSTVGFVKEVKGQSAAHDVELVTVSELETSLIDFRRYAHEMVLRLEADAALSYFVEPLVRREHLSVPQSGLAVLNDWLTDPQLNHLTLLGDYGTGKTTLLKYFTLVQARRYEQQLLEGGRSRVPIFVDLREYTHAISLKQIILDLLDTNAIRPASYSAFEHLLNEGQVLLVLDGFDEMASRGNYEVTLRNFKEINRRAIARAKIILSCRTHYFTTDQEVLRFHGQRSAGAMPRAYTDLYREIAARPNFSIVHLLEFEPSQVASYVRARCGKGWEAVQSFIQSTYNLPELSRRPVLLDMIVQSSGRISAEDRVITPGTLYQVYTDIWLSRNDWSSIVDIETKAALLERFAKLAAARENWQLHYKEIPEIIRSWRGDLTEIDASEIDTELRTASFLVRDQNGNYRFSHKSFQEFFFARHLLSEAGIGRSNDWGQGYFSGEVYRFIRDLLPMRPAAMLDLCSWLQDEGVAEYARANAAKCVAGLDEGRARDGLLAMLRDHNRVLRRCAATALRYYPGIDTVAALVAQAKSDECEFVRANSLIALARHDDPTARAFVRSVIEGGEPLVPVGTWARWPVFHAARDFSDRSIVEACIRNAPMPAGARGSGEKPSFLASEACLELCKQNWSADAEAYCATVLAFSERPRIVARAFAALPSNKKLDHFPKIRRMVDVYSNGRPGPVMVALLRGIHHDDVRDLLCSLIEKETASATAALQVLAAEYPECMAASAPRWLASSNRYDFRLALIAEYGQYLASADTSLFVDLLKRKRRIALKRYILQFLHSYRRCEFVTAFPRIWDADPSPAFRRHALELLRSVDREAALQLMLRQGISDPRVGTRVGVCAILSAEPGQQTTLALLKTLQSDDSKWVRWQALRSLCSPGRKVDRVTVQKVLAHERDDDVISLGRELLGTF